MTKRKYHRPELTEYGRVERITLGQTGSSPDQTLWNGILIDINNICDPSQPHPGLICS
jgi:hypothetical protein